jgi:hypothetical protein
MKENMVSRLHFYIFLDILLSGKIENKIFKHYIDTATNLKQELDGEMKNSVILTKYSMRYCTY